MLSLVPSVLCYSTYTTACTLRSLNIITMKTIFRIVCIALMCTYSLSLAADDSVMVTLSDLRALEARIVALEAQSKPQFSIHTINNNNEKKCLFNSFKTIIINAAELCECGSLVANGLACGGTRIGCRYERALTVY